MNENTPITDEGTQSESENEGSSNVGSQSPTASPKSPAPGSKLAQDNLPVFKVGQTVTKKLNTKDVDRLNIIRELLKDKRVDDVRTGKSRPLNTSEILAYALKVAAVKFQTKQPAHEPKTPKPNQPKNSFKLGFRV